MQLLRRETCPLFFTRRANPDGEGINPYLVTREHAFQEGEGEPAADAKSESQSSNRNKSVIWPTDIFGNKKVGQVAHLIPSSPRDATLYADVAFCVLGGPGNPDWRTRQRMIHGSKGVNGRHAHTGIKHSVPNKIRLLQQELYFDGPHNVFIVPVLTLDQAKRWRGGAYDAVVMVGHSENHSLGEVCTGIRMVKPPNADRVEPATFEERYCIANRGQVVIARQLLEDVLLGMADSLIYYLNDPEVRGGDLTDKQAEVLHNLGGDLLFGGQVWLPKANDGEIANDGEFRVRLVRFETHIPRDIPADGAPYLNHPAPDPLLLAFRAGVAWSSRHGQKMLAAVEPQDEDDDLSDMAYDQYLADYADAIRAKDPESLARGLHQEGGYVEGKVS